MSKREYTIDDLRKEQVNIKRKLRLKEEEISYKIGFLRRNFPAILLFQVMPFDKKMNEAIVNGLEWAARLFLGDLALKGKEYTSSIFEKISGWMQSLFSRFKKEDTSNDAEPTNE